MRLTVSTTILLSLLTRNSNAVLTCGPASATYNFGATCDLAQFNANQLTPCLTEIYGAGNEQAGADEICADAGVPFGDITNLHYQHDQTYFDGGTTWNDGSDAFESLSSVTGRVLRAKASISTSTIIAWPKYRALEEYKDNGYPFQFDLSKTCQSEAAMCCFTDRRSTSEALVDNVDVCTHDLRDSMYSNHVNRGWAWYKGDETPTHCVGFSWKDKPLLDEFKGNLLYKASLENTVTNGYIKNIPGAPMCGCMETMPTVANSPGVGCIDLTVSGTRDYKISLNKTATEEEGYFSASVSGITVSYGTCNGQDLLTNNPALSDRISSTDCDVFTTDFLNDRFQIPGTDTSFIEPDHNEWEPVSGEGVFFYPVNVGDERLQIEGDYAGADADFRSKLAESPNNIVRRVCATCSNSHKDIFYKRLTDLPDASELNFLDLFRNNWVDTPKNEFNVDFKLYSTYQDAIADTNAWTYCNFNGNTGFPRDCGPYGYVGNNWNSYTRGGGIANHHAFYVETTNASTA